MYNVDTMAMIYWGARHRDILPTVEKSIIINIQNPRGGVQQLLLRYLVRTLSILAIRMIDFLCFLVFHWRKWKYYMAAA